MSKILYPSEHSNLQLMYKEGHYHGITSIDLIVTSCWCQVASIEVNMMSRMCIENDHWQQQKKCENKFCLKKNCLKKSFGRKILYVNVWHQFDANSWSQFDVDSLQSAVHTYFIFSITTLFVTSLSQTSSVTRFHIRLTCTYLHTNFIMLKFWFLPCSFLGLHY